MSHLLQTRTRARIRRKVGGAGLAVVAIVLGVLAVGGTFSSGTAFAATAGGASNTEGEVHVVTAVKASPSLKTSEMYPFGPPSEKPAFHVPSPPGAPSLVPTIDTKTTTRLYGTNPFQEAVAVTQHQWPAALPLNAPNENNNVPDRPWGLTLVTPDEPLTAITATPLVHFPDDAPILYVTNKGIPKITENEIKRLGDTGISRYHNVDAFLVGAAANPGVEKQLEELGLKYATVTAPNVPALANTVDQLYGSVQNPDTGVPAMENGMENVMIGSMESYKYLLPATHWVSHMASGLLWVDQNSVPEATIEALKRRNGHARIYLFGGPQQISNAVADELSQYGTVIRITNDNNVAFNKNPKDTAVDTAIAFAKMWDPAGEVGWKITGPGHGFTVINENDWQGAVASAPMSHMGFHAPLLLTHSPTKLPSQLEGYFKSVAPTYLNTPADGPYNMTYLMGSWNELSWSLQTRIDYISEMNNRRVWNTQTGSGYADSQPTG
jgi:hypothetical protein